VLKHSLGGHALDRYLIDFDPTGDASDGAGAGDAGASGEAAASAAAAADAAGTGADAAGRTFSQADVDRIVQERLARAKTTPPADYDELKTKAAGFDKIEEANKTELQKAQDARAKAEREASQAAELVQRTRLESSIVAEAAKRGVDPDIAVAMIDRSTVEFDGDGKPTNIADAMDSLLQAKPQLAGGSRGTSADQGARNGGADQLGRDSLKTMSPEAVTQALSEGKLDRLLSGRS
jgi:hypothetical protein